MSSISYEKYHGTGNDFIVIDADVPLSDRRAFAIAHCDRERGVENDRPEAGRIGADGMLFLSLDEGASPPRVEMEHYQPDGSTAAMCGNGARCAALWAARRVDAERFVVNTASGTHTATIEPEGITIEMGVPTFEPDEIPVDCDEPMLEKSVAGYEVTAVGIGVPHAVIVVDDVNEIALSEIAPPIRHAAIFPEGANVTICASTRTGGFTQRTYERGVEGETLACGTGAVAIVAVAQRLGLHDGEGPVTVSPPGGDLVVTISETDGVATLFGPVTFEWHGELGPSSVREQ